MVNNTSKCLAMSLFSSSISTAMAWCMTVCQPSLSRSMLPISWSRFTKQALGWLRGESGESGVRPRSPSTFSRMCTSHLSVNSLQMSMLLATEI